MNRPAAADQGGAGGCGIRRVADGLDDLVDIGDGDGEANQQMGAFARLFQLKDRCGGG